MYTTNCEVPLYRIRSRWLDTAIGKSLNILSKSDRKKVFAVVILQVSLGILDLLGVLIIGLLGALSVSGVQSGQPGEQVSSLLTFLSISDLSFQTQAAILASSALLLLVGRTILSIIFTRRILFFFSRRGAKISANLISRLLSQPLLTVQARTTQETLYAVTNGVSLITLQILATSIVMVSDLSLLLVMTLGIFLVDPLTAVGTFVLFSFIGFFLYRYMHVLAKFLGVKHSELSIVSSEKIVEVFGSYRESVVRNRRDFYAREIGKIRYSLAEVEAESSFMPFVSKYVIETAVVVGALLVGAAQFVLQDSTQAVATLAIFLAAGTRIAPAVLRLQQGFIQIRGSLGAAQPTFDLINSLGSSSVIENVDDTVDVIHEGFIPKVLMQNVSLTYPNKELPAISEIFLSIQPGTVVAVVGLSGAGKTTIIDVLLGVLTPDEGSVLISGLSPSEAVSKWPGAIGYVPQDVAISAGSIRENVAQGFPKQQATDELVTSALKVAQLDRFVANLPEGLDTQVGERGAKISGGQRQRLGIARAMFTRPHLLVLDEATSSLDGETEVNISEAIQELRGSTTVVLIAHRLSTVRNADSVIYLSDGKIKAMGTFDEVREAVADFDRQAKLMGL
jgi:ABC-type multidrug transport system fused ATPase/permease subunit